MQRRRLIAFVLFAFVLAGCTSKVSEDIPKFRKFGESVATASLKNFRNVKLIDDALASMMIPIYSMEGPSKSEELADIFQQADEPSMRIYCRAFKEGFNSVIEEHQR
jgi:hypothetical protein